MIWKFYKTSSLKSRHLTNKFDAVSRVSNVVLDLQTELCYYIEAKTDLDEKEINLLKWILVSPYERKELQENSAFENKKSSSTILIEIGPRYVF